MAWLVRAALVAVVLWLLWRVFQRLKEVVIDRRRPPPRPTHVEFDLLDDPEPLAEEIRKDASEQFALLLSGHPRNAIVACWDRFEEQAERVGAARRDWETSSEFTLRLLAAVAADHDSVARLEGLYREARFSDHAIDESHRESAVAALRGTRRQPIRSRRSSSARREPPVPTRLPTTTSSSTTPSTMGRRC